MEQFRAFVSLDFFRGLLPFNAELKNGNAMIVRACGTGPADGTILRSRSYLLFGNGLATLSFPFPGSDEEPTGFFMNFTEKEGEKGARYWEVQSDPCQAPSEGSGELSMSYTRPDPCLGGWVRILAESEGERRQYFFITF